VEKPDLQSSLEHRLELEFGAIRREDVSPLVASVSIKSVSVVAKEVGRI